MKKFLTILFFIAVFGMLISSVSGAIDMHSMDFDNGFTIDAPDEPWIGDQVPFGEGYYGGGISIHHFTEDDLQGTSLDEYIELQQYDEVGTDGNLTIYQNGNKYVVLTQSDNEYCLITDSDLDEAKEIANSAVFASSTSDEKTTEPSTPVNATVELESHDFNGFKMDVPKGSSFKETTDDDAEFNGATVYSDSANDVNITFMENDEIDDNSVNQMVDSLQSEAGAEVSTNGNLNIFSVGQLNEVVFNEDNKMMLIVSSELDLDTITAMAQSVEFTD